VRKRKGVHQPFKKEQDKNKTVCQKKGNKIGDHFERKEIDGDSVLPLTSTKFSNQIIPKQLRNFLRKLKHSLKT